MYRFVLIACLFFAAPAFTQDSAALPKGSQDSIVHTDSNVTKSFDQGWSYFARLQKERKAQQKKKAIIYIVLGVFFMAVFVAGMVRRGKRQGK